MDFFIDIIESTAMFLETKAKFFMSINNKDEEKKRKKYFSIVFIFFELIHWRRASLSEVSKLIF